MNHRSCPVVTRRLPLAPGNARSAAWFAVRVTPTHLHSVPGTFHQLDTSKTTASGRRSRAPLQNVPSDGQSTLALASAFRQGVGALWVLRAQSQFRARVLSAYPFQTSRHHLYRRASLPCVSQLHIRSASSGSATPSPACACAAAQRLHSHWHRCPPPPPRRLRRGWAS